MNVAMEALTIPAINLKGFGQQQSTTGKVVSTKLSTVEGEGFAGRSWRVLQDMTHSLTHMFTSTDGIYQSAKLLRSLFLGCRVALDNAGPSTYATLEGCAEEVQGLISPVGIVTRLNVFTSGDYLKMGAFKVAKHACLVVSKSTEGLKWLAKRGAVDLGRLASTVGGHRLFTLTQMAAVGTVKSSFVIAASTFGIVDSSLSLMRPDNKSVFRSALAIINDFGKIILTVFAAHYFTYGFVAVGLITTASAITRILLDLHEAAKAPSEEVKA